MSHPAARPPGAPHPGQSRAILLARTFGIWVIVVAGAAFGLRVADALPRAAIGLPRGVRLTADLGELDRLSGRRMPVPAYYPDSIEWPPAETRLDTNGSAAIWCRQRPAGGLALIVATAPPGHAGIAEAVLPASVELQQEGANLGGRSAVVSRVRDANGAVWQQVQWQAPEQHILIRYRGTLDELLRLARSVHE
jgi:hypothetical protein